MILWCIKSFGKKGGAHTNWRCYSPEGTIVLFNNNHMPCNFTPGMPFQQNPQKGYTYRSWRF